MREKIEKKGKNLILLFLFILFYFTLVSKGNCSGEIGTILNVICKLKIYSDKRYFTCPFAGLGQTKQANKSFSKNKSIFEIWDMLE